MTTGWEGAAFKAMDRRLDPTSTGPIAVALSGGGDSLALLSLTLDWARWHGRRVLALTLDHDLNPASGQWTAEAGARARGLGAEWRALLWEGAKPTTGLQAKARAARHAMLADAARESGARVLLMGHTASDIAEGELMRATDTPGLGQVREWGPSPAWPEGRGIFLLRPLLGALRSDLRAYLDARGAAWLEDPANDNPAFARIRARNALSSTHPSGGGDQVRAALPSVQEGAPNPASALPVAKGWVPASAGLSGGGMADIVRQVGFGSGKAELAQATLVHSDPYASKPVLAALLLCVSGTTRPPRGPELDRLLGMIARGGTATLAGCRVAVEGDKVAITRAPPRKGFAPRPFEPGYWIAERFYAACGAFPNEASIP